MKLLLRGHDDRYAVEQLQLALFPEEPMEPVTEPFSGAPVIVADAAAIAPLIPREEEGCRLVPFHTVSGSGLLRAFRPDDLVIECAGRVTKPPQAYLAVSAQPVSQGEFSALLHPSLLE